jgi:predicted phosphodiesterase
LNSIIQRSTLFTNDFQVAIISDSHNYYKYLRKQINLINKNKNKIAFVIHTGDATNLGLKVEWDFFYNEIKRLDIPIVMAIGNHDMLSNGKEIYQKLFGKDLDFTFSFKQTKFILFNNNNWESSGLVPNLNFIDKQLSNSIATHDLLFGHIQFDDPDRFTNSEIENMKRLVNLYDVNYVISGHNHNAGAGVFGVATRLTVGASVKGELLLLFISDEDIDYQYVSI